MLALLDDRFRDEIGAMAERLSRISSTFRRLVLRRVFNSASDGPLSMVKRASFGRSANGAPL